MTASLVSLYQCDPEFRIVQAFNEFIAEMNLGVRNINTAELFVQGHPLYENAQRANSQESDIKVTDSFFPRCGAEWQIDEPSEDTGQNQTENLRMDYVRERIRVIRDQGYYLLGPDGLSQGDAEYEQVSWKNFNDFLNLEGYAEMYERRVQSNVSISGWATGNSARKTSQWLYMAVDAVLPFVVTDLRRRFRVDVVQIGSAELNLHNDQFDDRAEGFELMLGVRQIKTSVRHNSGYGWPKKPSIHFPTTDGKTTLNLEA